MSISRNDPCLCGSGLKYKKCCLGHESTQVLKARKVTKISVLTLTLISAYVALQFGISSALAVGVGGFGLIGGFLLMQDS